MNATGATATFRSILDKPLHQLTEDDISQITREDCRRFLKEKGMRRPSWNKSQAIQQVISLKALLESSQDDSTAHTATPQGNLSQTPPAKDPVVHAPDELQKPPVSPDKATETNDTNAVSPKGCAPSGSVGQMTIFYCGKVNVYDGVPPDKAQAIMQLAASPVHIPQDDPSNRNTVVWASPCHLPMDKDVLVPVDKTTLQVSQADVKGQASRKVSLQRYLEKRKDRGRLKGKKLNGITSSNLEMYLNLPVKVHASNGTSSRSSTSSPPQPRLPLASGGSADNQLKVALPIDLNDRDVQEC